MKEFNLEEAINGKAFYLKNGYRGVIKYCVDDILTSEDRTPRFAYIGYVLDNRGFLNLSKAAWDENGITNEPRSYDAVGMVEDMLEQNTEEKMKMKMKPFDLKAALNGETVMLRNGCKAIVYYKVPDEYKFADNKPVLCPLKGLMFDVNGNLVHSAMYWYASGKFDIEKDHSLDIIGMWEKPKIRIEDLPKPFKPATQEQYFTITSKYKYDPLYVEETANFNTPIDNNLINQGNAFRTREDAQKWLDFMKSMME